MNLFKKLKIKTKLLLAFLTLSFLILLISAFGVISLKASSDNTKEMYEVNLQTTYALTDMSRNLNRIKSDMLELIFVRDAANRYNLKTDIETIKTIDDSYIETYDKALSESSEKAIWQYFKDQLEQYRQLRQSTLELLDSGKYDEAETKNKEASAIMDKAIEKLDEIVAVNIDDAAQENAENIEINKKTNLIMTVIMILGFIIAIGLGLLMSYHISTPLNKIKEYAERLSNYDFSLPISITRTDEFGQTGVALNSAQENIKDLIKIIKSNSEELSAASEELSASAEELTTSSQEIEKSIINISLGVEETSSSSQEITASIEEVNARISELSQKAFEGSSNAKSSKTKATEVKEKSKLAIDETRKLHEEKREKILDVMEQGKSSNDIKVMAETIASITEQTNLLALNAAIEAARAGEQGKGFAIVADEIRLLAEQSSQSVVAIQDTISKVQNAFKASNDTSNDILTFINTNINKQLDAFENTGNQYFEDADFVSKMSQEISSMSEEIAATVDEVSKASECLSELSQQSSENAESIKDSITETTKVIEQIAIAAQGQAGIAEKLTELVQRFII